MAYATAEVLEETTQAPPPPGPPPATRRRGGRPTNEERRRKAKEILEKLDDEADDEKAAETEEPTPDAAPQPTGDFFEALSALPRSEWEELYMLYLYRVAPKIDLRGPTGKYVYVCKYAEPITQDRVMVDYGSGGYRLDLTRKDELNSNRTKRVRQHYFTIINMQYPPIVPDGAWIDLPENEMWKWAKPSIAHNSAPGGPFSTPAASSDPNRMLDGVFSTFERLNKLTAKDDTNPVVTAMAAQLATVQQAVVQLSDPQRTLAMINALTPQRTGPDPIVQFLQDQMKELRAELREARSSRFDLTTALQSLDTWLPAAEKFLGAFGFSRRGKAGEPNEWAEVATKALNEIGPHLPFIFDRLVSKPDPARQPANRPGPVVQHQVRTATANAQAQPQQEAAADAPPLTPEETQQLQAILDKFKPVLTQSVPFMIDFYNDPEMTGYDFRDWFFKRIGELKWMELLNEVGSETFVKLAQQNSMLREKLTPPDRLKRWMDEFFTPQDQGPAPDQEE